MYKLVRDCCKHANFIGDIFRLLMKQNIVIKTWKLSVFYKICFAFSKVIQVGLSEKRAWWSSSFHVWFICRRSWVLSLDWYYPPTFSLVFSCASIFTRFSNCLATKGFTFMSVRRKNIKLKLCDFVSNEIQLSCWKQIMCNSSLPCTRASIEIYLSTVGDQ